VQLFKLGSSLDGIPSTLGVSIHNGLSTECKCLPYGSIFVAMFVAITIVAIPIRRTVW
jgi:hypothetical protein